MGHLRLPGLHRTLPPLGPSRRAPQGEEDALVGHRRHVDAEQRTAHRLSETIDSPPLPLPILLLTGWGVFLSKCLWSPTLCGFGISQAQ